MKIILGSSSPRREQLMRDWGYSFDIRNPQIDERAIRSDDLRDLPLRIAHAKADYLRGQLELDEPAILITCDTIVLHDGLLREKPLNAFEAKEFLTNYGRTPAEVICGLVITNTETGRSVDGIESAKIYFHKIPETVIDELIRLGVVYDWAGGFHPDHPSIRPHVAYIEGERELVLGLPRNLTHKLMREVT